ncbi:hypothetical protein [Streptomyces sp. NPDC048252]|uniref:hypothetical protein n=1 Tax=Streptomyces sp. NPDC048252 TaxID=3154612 RepID=UPI00341391D9
MNRRQLGPYHLVPVAQLTAADLPEIHFPQGADPTRTAFAALLDAVSARRPGR